MVGQPGSSHHEDKGWWHKRTSLEKVLISVLAMGCFALIALVLSVIVTVPLVKSSSEQLENRTAHLNRTVREAYYQINEPSYQNPSEAYYQAASDSYYQQPNQQQQQPIQNYQQQPEQNYIPPTSASGICETPGCIHAASKIIDSIDPSVNPCEDFYRFACGKYIANTIVPEDKYLVTPLTRIDDIVKDQLLLIMSEPPLEGEPKALKLAKLMYQTCMNKATIEDKGLGPIFDAHRRMGGWPVLEGNRWDPRHEWTWVKATKKFRKLGYSANQLIQFSVRTDYMNSTQRYVDFDQPSFGLNRELLILGLQDETVQAYFDYMVEVAVVLGASREFAMIDLRDSLEFEIKLAEITLPKEQRRNATQLHNPIPLSQVQMLYPYADWKDYITALLPSGVTITNDEIINISVLSYMRDLGMLLSATPNRVIANYLIWRVTQYTIPFLNDQMRALELQFKSKVFGQSEQEPRWKECVDMTTKNLGISVGASYIRRFFDKKSKETATEMIENIRKQFEIILHHSPWMDDSTRAAALNKLALMVTHIGYPDELSDPKKLEEFYQKLELIPDSHLQSMLNVNNFLTDKSFSKLRNTVNKTDWVTHSRPAVVNAYYSPTENSIQVPAGILQGQFFAADRPKYMNYGGIGFVMGHEVTHGFDDQGRQFDETGNLHEWWNPQTREAFFVKAQCIIDQYSNFTDPIVGLNLNGINTQGENIADNGGIKQSYYAYRQWAYENGMEPKLPGLDYEPQQMFWLSAATTWCAAYRPEILKLLITSGMHAPQHFRVLGPFKNMPEFSQDFNCPVNSPMNPAQKCEVW